MAGKKQPARYASCHPQRICYAKALCEQYIFEHQLGLTAIDRLAAK